jgi:hypothetical protein
LGSTPTSPSDVVVRNPSSVARDGELGCARRRAEDAAADAPPLADADPHAVLHADGASDADAHERADDAHADDCTTDGRADEPRADVGAERSAIAHADQPAEPCADQPADRGADDQAAHDGPAVARPVAHADRAADQHAVDPAHRRADRTAVAHSHARADDAHSGPDARARLRNHPKNGALADEVGVANLLS